MRLNVLRAFTLFPLIIVVTVINGNTHVFAQDPPPVDILIQETVGVSDGSAATSPASVELTEDVTVDDSVSVIGPATVSITEQITVSDSVAILGPAEITITEHILVSDTGGVVSSAPVVDAGASITIDEGSPAALAASVIVLDPQLTTATIDWGDGSTIDQVVPTTVGAIPATHLYSNDGVFTVSVTVTGLFGDAVADTTQVEVINLAPIVDPDTPYTIDLADPVSTVILTAVASDPGGDPITYAWDFDEDGQFDDATGEAALLPYSTVGSFIASVEVQDDLGAATTQAYPVSVIDTGDGNEDAPETDDNDSGPDSDSDSDDDPPTESAQTEAGKVSGRAVIGLLVRMSNTEIVLAVKTGVDFTHVRVHIDSAATDMAASLDAEAYTLGSKIVLVADSDVLSGNATALRIVPVPGTATRKHDRVIVSKPNDGNTVQLVSGDEGVGDSVVKDDNGQYKAGDQIVVLTHRGDSNRRDEKPRVIVNNNDIKDRLEEFARTKFDNGDTSGSGLIDRLAQARLDREQEKIDRAKRHADEAVRKAAELADEKAKRAADKDAADPVRVIRNKVVSDSESDILECAARVVGRSVAGENDLSAEELRRVMAECFDGDEDRDGDVPDRGDDAQRRSAPPEVLDCIVRVLGSVPNRPITAEEKVRLNAACSFDDDEDDEHEDDKSAKERADERNSTKSVDARKLAFCASNPSDRHCTGGASGSSDDKGDDSTSDADKRAFCAANPTVARCTGSENDSGKPESKDGESGTGDDDSKNDDRTKGSESDDDRQTKDSDTKPPGK